MTDEFVVEQEETETPQPDDENVEPTSEFNEEVVVESTLSDVEREAQERHEALAETLAPGETLPWVAPTPSAVQPAPDAEEAKGEGSEIPSSRTETAEQPPETEDPEDTETRNT